MFKKFFSVLCGILLCAGVTLADVPDNAYDTDGMNIPKLGEINGAEVCNGEECVVVLQVTVGFLQHPTNEEYFATLVDSNLDGNLDGEPDVMFLWFKLGTDGGYTFYGLSSYHEWYPGLEKELINFIIEQTGETATWEKVDTSGKYYMELEELKVTKRNDGEAF